MILKNTQILTRYCTIDSPYWQSFIMHYENMGVSQFHVCCQTKEEIDELESFASKGLTSIYSYLLPLHIPPNEAIKYFQVKNLRKTGAKYTLMVDSDEYFVCLNSDGCLDDYMQIDSLSIPWLMNPLDNALDDRKICFLGHTSKPLCVTKNIKGLLGDHKFKTRYSYLKRVYGVLTTRKHPIVPTNCSNFFLIHYWSRSIEDTLLKIFFSRFKSLKQSDQQIAKQMLENGILPNRLKLHAFLAVQNRQIALKDINCDLSVDQDKESHLLSKFLNLEEIDNAKSLYVHYVRCLTNLKPELMAYPSKAVPTLQHAIRELSNYEKIKA